MTDDKKKRSTKRRGNGEGSIFQRPDGRWCARVTVGIDENGRRKRKDVYAWTKTEVQEKLGEMLQQKRQGTLATIGKLTVGEYLTGWLENTVKPNFRVGTWSQYDYQIRGLVLPYVGGIKLTKLGGDNLLSLYATIRGLGKSPRRVQIIHTILRKAFRLAVKAGKLTRNPCDLIERPQAPQKEMKTFTGDESRAFLLAIEGHRLKALFVLALTTGLRQGEMLGLKWTDIDFEEGKLQVRRTVNLVRNEFVINEPKTKAGKRTVILPGVAVEALEDHRRQMMVEGFAGHEWVFPSQRGGFLRRDILGKAFRRILTNAKLPTIRFHDLRHSHCTLLMEQGVSAKVMQERLGHSKIATTLGIYAHVLPSMQQEAADKTERIFKVS